MKKTIKKKKTAKRRLRRKRVEKKSSIPQALINPSVMAYNHFTGH